MALTQVRVKFNGEWIALTYNEATGRYEGHLEPGGTSIHQPGGYFPLEVEAVNEAGDTARADGETNPALRLVVRETAAPTLALVSPSPGYLTTDSPTFVFSAQDEAGGSGIDASSARVAVDGTERLCTVTESGGAYRVSCAVTGLPEGRNTVTAAISDRDGNQTTASAAYTVDTLPPELYILAPYLRHVVDDESVEIVALAQDTNGVRVTVDGKPAQEEGGRWRLQVPLRVGENHITVTATDGAGLTTTAELYMIRLVTDRTQADVHRLVDLYRKVKENGWGSLSQKDQDWFPTAPCLRGSYDPGDRNRVGIAVGFLTETLKKMGYAPSTQPKTDWTEDDTPVRGQMDAYLTDVRTIRDVQPVSAPLPATLRKSGVEDWNQIEKALVEVDAVFPHYSAWTAGEITAAGGY